MNPSSFNASETTLFSKGNSSHAEISVGLKQQENNQVRKSFINVVHYKVGVSV
jgi:hypothetical protein